MARTSKSTPAGDEGGEAKAAPAKRSRAKTAPSSAAGSKPASSRSAKKPAAKTGAAAGQKADDAAEESTHFDKKFLDEQRKLLHAERERYFRSAVSLKAEADALVESREPGDVQFDEESGEGDTLAVERERDLALSAHARQAVEEIDAALERLDAGTYGICEVSGKPIPRERLKAIPWATTRVEYKAGGLRLR